MDDFGFTRLDAERKAPVLYARSIGSTNNALKKLAAQGAPDGTVLWASEQTAGRGRLGRMHGVRSMLFPAQVHLVPGLHDHEQR